MLQIPELLAPAGDLERLRYAINYGADAVYCSLPEFGMRSAPANFTPEQLTEGVIYAHARGRKVYLTMNTLPTNEEADRLPDAIKEAAKAGVDSLKIEGRAKTFYYVASVTAAYRKALDAYLADPANDNFELPAEVYEELTRTSHRHYSPGFYFGREQAKQATDSATYIREWEFVGTVDRWENGVAHCQQRGKWSLGDTLEALCPDGRSIPLTPEWIENEAGERVDSTPHAMEKYTMPTPELPPMSLLRRKTAE